MFYYYYLFHFLKALNYIATEKVTSAIVIKVISMIFEYIYIDLTRLYFLSNAVATSLNRQYDLYFSEYTYFLHEKKTCIIKKNQWPYNTVLKFNYNLIFYSKSYHLNYLQLHIQFIKALYHFHHYKHKYNITKKNTCMI